MSCSFGAIFILGRACELSVIDSRDFTGRIPAGCASEPFSACTTPILMASQFVLRPGEVFQTEEDVPDYCFAGDLRSATSLHNPCTRVVVVPSFPTFSVTNFPFHYSAWFHTSVNQEAELWLSVACAMLSSTTNLSNLAVVILDLALNL